MRVVGLSWECGLRMKSCDLDRIKGVILPWSALLFVF